MKYKNPTYLYIFPTVKIVEGYKNTLLIDFQTKNVHFISKEIALLVTKLTAIEKYLEELKGTPEEEIVNEIIAKGFGMRAFLKEEHSLIDHANVWEFPSKLSNCIVDIENLTNYDVFSTIDKINALNCFYIEIRINTLQIPGSEVLRLIKHAHNLSFRSIELTLDHGYKSILEALAGYDKIHKVFLFNSPVAEAANYRVNKALVIETPNVINASKCGHVSPLYFSTAPEHYFESCNYNSCLNKKLGIDTLGNIKNCPSFTKSFGHVQTHTIDAIVDDEAFKALWSITKDEIDVCRDCEFRHICTDCRAFTDHDRPNSRPAKCTYNPYIGKWENETGYKTLEECGVVSNDTGMFIDHGRIAEINKELLGEITA